MSVDSCTSCGSIANQVAPAVPEVPKSAPMPDQPAPSIPDPGKGETLNALA